MNIAVKLLFTVGIDHPYYAERCRDFRFLVPNATADTLGEGKLLTREEDGALQVYYQADENGARLADLTGHSLLFALRLTNGSFENFTEPPIADRTRTPCYRNTAVPTALDPAVAVQVVCGTYVHAPEQPNRPVTLALSDGMGNVVAKQTVELPGDAPAFDLHSLPEGWWTVTEDYGAGAVHPRRLLLDAGLAIAGIWALVDVKVDNAFYGTPASLDVPLDARSEPLEYYVVAPTGFANFGTLKIQDDGFADPPPRTEVKFNYPAVAPGANDLKPSQVGRPGDQVGLFRSIAPVERREIGLRKINLVQNGTALIENLPQPNAQKARARLVIHLSNP